MELTQEQAEAVRCDPESQLELIDPITQRCYVLVAREVLQQIQEDAADARQTRGWHKATQQGMGLALKDDE